MVFLWGIKLFGLLFNSNFLIGKVWFLRFIMCNFLSGDNLRLVLKWWYYLMLVIWCKWFNCDLFINFLLILYVVIKLKFVCNFLIWVFNCCCNCCFCFGFISSFL